MATTPSSPHNLVSKHVAYVLERIAELNPTLNAFISVFEGDAMEQARVLDEELRLVARPFRMAGRFPSRT